MLKGYYEIVIIADENGPRNQKGERLVSATIPVHGVSGADEAVGKALAEVYYNWPLTKIYADKIYFRQYAPVITTA